jgi:alpha-glucosidase
MLTLEKPKKFQKTPENQHLQESPWNNAVIYQIYPRTFQDSNGDGNGDIKGITSRLDYIKSLGVDVIWVCPMFESPMADGGYDVKDHKAIDPIFGTMEDFDNLIGQAHERGIGVMIDIMPNHTSEEHEWFKASRDPKHPDHEKYKDYYIWQDMNPARKDNRPNNWASVFSMPNISKYKDKYESGEIDHIPADSAWTWDDKRQQYYLHSFMQQQPDLNWENPAVVEEVLDIMRFCLDKGVDGFRIDAVNYIAKNPSLKDEEVDPNYEDLRDNPYDRLIRHNSAGYPKNLYKRLQKLIDVLKEDQYKDRSLRIIFEAYMSEEELAKIDQLDPEYAGTFNFTVMDSIRNKLKAFILSKTIEGYERRMPNRAIANEVLGNHDKSRIVTALGSEKAARALAVVTSMLPGELFIYQGDEAGFVDSPIAEEDKKDKAGGRDGSRTPMAWLMDKFGGFSEADISKWYLKPHKTAQRDNIENEIKDSNSTLNLYARLINARKLPSAKDGLYLRLDADNEDILSFARRNPDDQIVVVANLSGKNQKTFIRGAMQNVGRVIISSEASGYKPGDLVDLENLKLLPMEAIVVGPQ